ncbi:glycosyltransferase family 2 protein [Paenibacillus chondroitinus]|uniref:Glycosyltransferase family 2 protein n=1 Tax=Paenibacillus chondroitinus TaxID=59842 RepID=A0ABU6DC79_9BACL|nr:MULTISPECIES: glycosyltransferase family 2 protein [Paenibacillus]MCY9656842.1 glycosyltransferase [Paenibacillus anseongense]MEB4794492.1 glycosyltransferase family 2 protein [Paenibacillus chondroitinus]
MNPLVSILIPTYNRPHYFELALQSAFNQTYDNIEIIVSDNSDNNQTELVVQKYQEMPGGAKIKYFKNPQNLGPIANQQQCLNLANGEFINYLMDDDLFHLRKIEKMMAYLIQYPDVTMVTSQRRVINAAGRQLYVPPIGTFKQLYTKDTIVDGRVLTKKILEDRINYLGEPTTVLFRRKALTEPFGMLLGRQAYFAVDMASWLSLLSKGKGVYMVQPLSYLRYHTEQLSQHEMAKEVAMMDIETFKFFAVNQGYATPQQIKEFEKQQGKMKKSNNQKTNHQTLEQINQQLLQGGNKKTNQKPNQKPNQKSNQKPIQPFNAADLQKTINKLIKQTNTKKKG